MPSILAHGEVLVTIFWAAWCVPSIFLLIAVYFAREAQVRVVFIISGILVVITPYLFWVLSGDPEFISMVWSLSSPGFKIGDIIIVTSSVLVLPSLLFVLYNHTKSLEINESDNHPNTSSQQSSAKAEPPSTPTPKAEGAAGEMQEPETDKPVPDGPATEK